MGVKELLESTKKVLEDYAVQLLAGPKEPLLAHKQKWAAVKAYVQDQIRQDQKTLKLPAKKASYSVLSKWKFLWSSKPQQEPQELPLVVISEEKHREGVKVTCPPELEKCSDLRSAAMFYMQLRRWGNRIEKILTKKLGAELEAKLKAKLGVKPEPELVCELRADLIAKLEGKLKRRICDYAINILDDSALQGLILRSLGFTQVDLARVFFEKNMGISIGEISDSSPQKDFEMDTIEGPSHRINLSPS